MVVVLRINHQVVSIFEKSHYFFIVIEGRTLDIPFSTYNGAHKWAERITQNHLQKSNDESTGQPDVRPDQGW
jgi:hypothetical protein